MVSEKNKEKEKTFLAKAGFHTKGIITGAIIFVAAFAWRDLFQQTLHYIPPTTTSKMFAMIAYTAIVTAVAILLAVLLGKSTT